ncbi:MAG: 50S ribosomal protein L4 [Pseudomonadota bacterium]|nr:50S ribosomal protein L4 [Pseudomonadota bacterium]
MELKALDGDVSIQVADSVFDVVLKEPLIHQVVVAYLAGGRAGTRAQKNRAAVRGGGAKPWRQKGTGRARAGTIRSPLWRSGGVTFAAQPRDHGQKVNRKMYRGAMRSILAELVRQERLDVVERLGVSEAKTKALDSKLKELGFRGGLIVVGPEDEQLALAARNLKGVDLMLAAQLNPAALVGAEKVLMTVDAVRVIEEWLG